MLIFKKCFQTTFQRKIVLYSRSMAAQQSMRVVFKIVSLFCCLLLIWSLVQKKENLTWYKNAVIELPKIRFRLQPEDPLSIIRSLCGDLCDLTKEVQVGEFLGTVRAKVGGLKSALFISLLKSR